MTSPPQIELHDDAMYLVQRPLGVVKITGPGWFLGSGGVWQFLPDSALATASCTADVLSVEAVTGVDGSCLRYEFHRPAIHVMRLAAEGGSLVLRDP